MKDNFKFHKGDKVTVVGITIATGSKEFQNDWQKVKNKPFLTVKGYMNSMCGHDNYELEEIPFWCFNESELKLYTGNVK